jgi:hypothetical protein
MHRFSDYIAAREGYSHEEPILSQLPSMDIVQQALLDKKLHQDAVGKGSFGSQSSTLSHDTDWKQKFIDIVQGRERRPEIIRQTIDIIRRDMQSHLGRVPNAKTGSDAWHRSWSVVYQKWLNKLNQILGAIDASEAKSNPLSS